MGIIAATDHLRPSIRRGVEYLARTQNRDGSWTEDYITGTGFPKVFYLKYDMYRNNWAAPGPGRLPAARGPGTAMICYAVSARARSRRPAEDLHPEGELFHRLAPLHGGPFSASAPCSSPCSAWGRPGPGPTPKSFSAISIRARWCWPVTAARSWRSSRSGTSWWPPIIPSAEVLSFLRLLTGFDFGVFCTEDEIAATRAQRDRCARRGQVVEMETAAVAAVVHGREIPFVALRAISDDYAHDLPAAALAAGFDARAGSADAAAAPGPAGRSLGRGASLRPLRGESFPRAEKSHHVFTAGERRAAAELVSVPWQPPPAVRRRREN